MRSDAHFERTLSFIEEVSSPSASRPDGLSPNSTINPILPSSARLESGVVDPGLTIPPLESLPALDVGEAPVLDGGEEQAAEEFTIKESLGEGGMGVVRLAYQRTLRREVVIKHPHEGGRTSNRVNALVKEGIVTGFLEHPNIVPIHLLGRMKDGTPALVMKRISGTSWRELIYDPAHKAWEQVSGDRLAWHLRVLVQVANAVDFAHSEGLIHRDIKTENVMIGHFGEVYLLDWGIAIRLDEEGEARPDYFAGTPSYMAPEMLESALSVKTDVYLLGATLHEVLLGAPRHDGESLEEVAWQARRSRAYTYPDDIPDELATICNRATACVPDERFASARAFREALEQHLEHRNAFYLYNTAKERFQWLDELADRGPSSLEQAARMHLHEYATECRFALREALRLWPDFPEGKALERSYLERMVEVELSLGQLANAEMLLAEHPDPPVSLRERLTQLRQEQQVAALAQDKLRTLEREQDNRIGLSRRSLLLGMLSVAVLFVSIFYALWTGKLFINTPAGGLGSAAIVVAIAATVAFVFRDTLAQTALNRHMTSIFFIGCVGVLISRTFPFVLGTSIEHAFLVDILLVGLGYTIAGFVLERRLLWGALCCGLSLVFGLLYPTMAYAAMVFTLVSSVLSVSTVWSQEGRHKAPQSGRFKP